MAFLKDIDKSNVASYGGKAASLGEMLAAGIPVPSGFAINVDAYKEFSGQKVSTEFEKELHQAFDKLGATRVAVRSSAVAEDAADASWAGQLESYLNVTEKKLLESIRKCWKSIDSQRAVAYAKDKKIDDSLRSVGVVVQVMVESQKSGVMFTVHPVLDDTNLMVIESLYGLGEMIVQGIVTPDNYIVQKKPLMIREFNISIKEKQMIFSQMANRVVNVDEDLADKATLREEEVLKLAKIGLGIEKHYGKPQDIEWAYVEGVFSIVQSRPITTLGR